MHKPWKCVCLFIQYSFIRGQSKFENCSRVLGSPETGVVCFEVMLGTPYPMCVGIFRGVKFDFEVEKKYTNHTNTVDCWGGLEKHIQNPLAGNFFVKLALKI